jgi:hypothetical protein
VFTYGDFRALRARESVVFMTIERGNTAVLVSMVYGEPALTCNNTGAPGRIEN